MPIKTQSSASTSSRCGLIPRRVDPDQFKRIRAAYEKLRTPERRAQTDMFLLQSPPAMPRRRLPTFDVSVHREDILALARELGWISWSAK